MAEAFERANVPRERYEFERLPVTDQSFENALAKARNGDRLTIKDGIELLTTGTDRVGIDPARKEVVLEAADRRRAAVVGDEVTFVANLNNNVTTACNTGCLFCNFKDRSEQFRTSHDGDHGGFTKRPAESRRIVRDAVAKGVYEVTSVSGLHPAFALDDEHREILETSDRGDLNYRSPGEYDVDPGTYCEQISAMAVDGVHVHSMTPEEAYHARRGTGGDGEGARDGRDCEDGAGARDGRDCEDGAGARDGWDYEDWEGARDAWDYETVYGRLADAGLDSVPGTAAEILVDEVREVICPGKIRSNEWVAAMEAAASVGLDTTATIMYGHVENERHRVEHLATIRDLQDRTGAITEFVPLSFVHQQTPLYERGMVDGGASDAEDELMIAVSRLFLDNVEHIQSSWVKFGDEKGLKLLSCGADDFMGTILSEEITTRAGGEHGEFRSVADYVSMIDAIGRVPVERSTDYRTRRRIDPEDGPPFGPTLGPGADGTPLLRE